MDEFMGRPKAQKTAVTGVGLSSDEESLGMTPKELEKEGAAKVNATILSQLLEQQKALAGQITALGEQDF
jgi:hypothetical protein